MFDKEAEVTFADDDVVPELAPPRFEPGFVARSAGSKRKRAMDIFGAGLGLLLFGIPMLTAAIIIRLETPGPALFRQRRTGLNGRIFMVYKLRTMVSDHSSNLAAGRADCRITKFGALLRKSSFDEMPQLFNVLRGEMSLVGPRPHAVEHDEIFRLQIAGYDDRFLALPGITGLAQIRNLRGGGAIDWIGARLKADREYIETWSWRQDLRILLATLPHLLLGEAY